MELLGLHYHVCIFPYIPHNSYIVMYHQFCLSGEP
jgi:hypothetical protein